MAKTKFEKRCEECAYLKKVKGVLVCDECFGQPIAEIDDCPEGVTFEQIEEIEKHAKENKVKIVNQAEGKEKKERKPRERKVDDVKVDFIKKIFDFIATFVENAEIIKAEREINFNIGDDSYTLTLTKHRKPKK